VFRAQGYNINTPEVKTGTKTARHSTMAPPVVLFRTVAYEIMTAV